MVEQEKCRRGGYGTLTQSPPPQTVRQTLPAAPSSRSNETSTTSRSAPTLIWSE
jgi:hypothetical protein